MTYAKRRSHRQSLLTGTTDGKYFKDRPDTELDAMNAKGDATVQKNKATLNPLNGYQSVAHPAQVSPGE